MAVPEEVGMNAGQAKTSAALLLDNCKAVLPVGTSRLPPLRVLTSGLLVM